MGRWGHSKDPPMPPILYFVQESSPGRMRSFLALFNNLCGFQLEYFIKGWVCCWGFFFSPLWGMKPWEMFLSQQPVVPKTLHLSQTLHLS